MSEIKDVNGKVIKVNDIVEFVMVEFISGGYTRGDKYLVTDVFTEGSFYERISTKCLKTGQENGWLSKYFKVVKPNRKSHFPEWF